MVKKTYHQLTKNEPPTPFLIKTLGIPVLITGNSLDLGCGSGNDTIELLKNNWSVTSIDNSTEAITFLKERTKNFNLADIRCVRFEDMELIKNFYDLVYSRYALSFCQKKDWAIVWNNILNAMKVGGVFSGHIFGVNDDFKNSKKYGEMSLFDSQQVDELFKDFDILFKNEDEYDAKSRVGQMKHWHVFTVVAKKK